MIQYYHIYSLLLIINSINQINSNPNPNQIKKEEEEILPSQNHYYINKTYIINKEQESNLQKTTKINNITSFTNQEFIVNLPYNTNPFQLNNQMNQMNLNFKVNNKDFSYSNRSNSNGTCVFIDNEVLIDNTSMSILYNNINIYDFVTHIKNYDYLSFILLQNKTGIWVMVFNNNVISYISLDQYIVNVYDNLPFAPSQIFSSKDYEYINLYINIDINRTSYSNSSYTYTYYDYLIGITKSQEIHIWKLSKSSIKSSIVYISYENKVDLQSFSFLSYLFSKNTMKLEVKNVFLYEKLYILVTFTDLIIFDSKNCYKIIDFHMIDSSIIVNERIYIGIKQKGVFILYLNEINLDCYSKNDTYIDIHKDNKDNKTYSYIDYINIPNLSQISYTKHEYLDIYLYNPSNSLEKSTNNTDFLYEINVFSIKTMKKEGKNMNDTLLISTIYSSSYSFQNKIISIKDSINITYIVYIENNHTNIIILHRNNYNFNTITLMKIVTISNMFLFNKELSIEDLTSIEFSLIYNENSEVSLCFLYENIIKLISLCKSTLILQCNINNKGMYTIYIDNDYDNEYDYTISILVDDEDKGFSTIYICISVVGGVVFLIILFIFLYKYKIFSGKKDFFSNIIVSSISSTGFDKENNEVQGIEQSRL